MVGESVLSEKEQNGRCAHKPASPDMRCVLLSMEADEEIDAVPVREPRNTSQRASSSSREFGSIRLVLFGSVLMLLDNDGGELKYEVSA